MGDLEAIIQGAVDAARESGDLSEDGGETAVEDTSTEEGIETHETSKVEVSGDADDEGTGDDDDESVSDDDPAKAKTAKDAKPAVDAKKKEEKPAETDDEDIDGTDAEALKKKAGKDNRIPYSEVTRILTNREKKTALAVVTALGLPGIDTKTYRPETFKSALDAHVAAYKELQVESADFKTVQPIMTKKPDQFLQMLAKTINPEYGEFVRKGTDTGGAKDAKAEVIDPNDPEPEPDFKLPDGSMTYSKDGHKKLRAWDRRQIKREAVEEAKKEFEGRISPFEKEKKDRETLESDQEQIARVIDTTLTRARKRRGFTDNEKEIRELVFSEFKDLPLAEGIDAAYEKIVIAQLVKTYDEVYKKVIDDIKKGARDTSISTGAPPKKEEPVEGAEDGDDSVTLAIRKSIAPLKRKAK